MSKRKIVKLVAPLLLIATASSPVFAHSGHGEWAAFAHHYEHVIWTLGAIAATGLLVNTGRKFLQKRAKNLAIKSRN